MIPSRAAYQVTSDTDPPRYAPGYWYTIAPTTAAAAGTATVNVIRAYPWVVRSRVRVQALGVRITTGAAGLMQLAIYRANASTLNPMGQAMANTNDIDVSVAQNVNGALVQSIVTLGPGLHWMCSWTNIGCSFQGNPLANTSGGVLSGASTQALLDSATTTVGISKLVSQTYGSFWPNADGLPWADAGTANTFLGQFQVAS
jgi:hypothetical protein